MMHQITRDHASNPKQKANRVRANTRGPRDPLNIRIFHSGAKAQDDEDTEIVPCGILVFLWSFGPQTYFESAKPPDHRAMLGSV